MSKNKIPFNTEQFLRTVTSAAVGSGLVPKDMYDFVAERGDKPLIVVAAAPRTGSTFLSNVLCHLTGVDYRRLCSAYSTNEHDLYLPALCIMNPIGCVSQLHMKGTYHNAALLNTFGIRPIILVRHIFDIIVSLMGDVRKKEHLPGFGSGQNGYSFIWLEPQLIHYDDERLLDALIDLAVPWYVNFYVSWYRLCQQGVVQAKWVNYEEMMSDKEQTLKEILGFLGVKQVIPFNEEILGRKFYTFNDSRVGRGDELLSEAQKERIRRLFSYYPDVDFSKYGL